MERIGSDHMKGTENMTTLKDWSLEHGNQDVSRKYAKKDTASSEHYDKMSKDGDTLEISKAGNFRLKQDEATGAEKVSVADLVTTSVSKLKQLYANKQITKQQYEKYMKQKSGEGEGAPVA